MIRNANEKSSKKHGTTLRGRPVCVFTTCAMLHISQDRIPTEAEGGEYVHILSEFQKLSPQILTNLRNQYFHKKNVDFRHSAGDWHP